MNTGTLKKISYRPQNYTANPVRFNTDNVQSELKKNNDRLDDIGYPLNLIERTDGRVEDDVNAMNSFHTGLYVAPPPEYYCVVYPTPELLKMGYMMSPFMLQPTNRDEIQFHLYKIAEGPDLQLPFPAGYLVLHNANHFKVAKSVDLDLTTLAGDIASKNDAPMMTYGRNPAVGSIPLPKRRGHGINNHMS